MASSGYRTETSEKHFVVCRHNVWYLKSVMLFRCILKPCLPVHIPLKFKKTISNFSESLRLRLKPAFRLLARPDTLFNCSVCLTFSLSWSFDWVIFNQDASIFKLFSILLALNFWTIDKKSWVIIWLCYICNAFFTFLNLFFEQKVVCCTDMVVLICLDALTCIGSVDLVGFIHLI